MRLTLWLSLFALSILSATRGAVTTLLPSPLPTALQQALHFLVLTFLFSLPAITQLKAAITRPMVLSMALLFPLPIIMSVLAEGHVSSHLQVVVFALLPVVIVLAVAHRTASFGPETEGRRLLVPAIAGAAGTLVLLPLGLPSSGLSRALLGLLVVSAVASALAGIRLHSLLAPVKIVPAAAVVSGTSTLLLAAFTLAGVARYPIGLRLSALVPDALLTLGLDAPILLLTLWLLREMHPIPFAARYLLIPLFSILAAILLLHPLTTPIMLGGLALMAGAALWLLLAKPPEAA
ncbi:hypothetical protein FTO74_11575 [Granulicella sp. WH15]|uniref:hypothetical protein n=1 Tax=Granulicella sp. WH15 TaxID=2602070 RepID=UPI00136749F4|nr:hypothetical protein [Granulicella sp. WH15]QHN03939.1 hypothetical protein FTO74_11575 [Granulicella sp. WH15]